MSLGGMRDHIGGGFHRYSVDAEWRVPHFEKMLYDQAQLALAFLEGAQASGEGYYADGGRGHAGVRRARAHGARRRRSTRPRTPTRCRQPSGTRRALTPPRSGKAPSTSGRGRARPAARRRRGPRDAVGSASSRTGTPRPIRRASSAGRTSSTSRSRSRTRPRASSARRRTSMAALARARPRLFEARAGRPRPQLDDKVLTAWNGLMIAGVRAGGARAREQPEARRVAESRRGCGRLDAGASSGIRRRTGCGGGTATGRRPSTASARTTRTSPGACSSCSRRRARQHGSPGRASSSRPRPACSTMRGTAAGSARPATTRPSCCG